MSVRSTHIVLWLQLIGVAGLLILGLRVGLPWLITRSVLGEVTETETCAYSGSDGYFQWDIHNGKPILRLAIVQALGVKGWSSGACSGKPGDTPADHLARRKTNIDHFDICAIANTDDVFINGELLVPTERGRVFVMQPDMTVRRLLLTKAEIDSITPQLVQNNPESSPVWRDKILPVINPAALIPVPEEVTRVRHELVNLIKHRINLEPYNGRPRDPSLRMLSLWTESSYGIFIANGQMIRGRPCFMNALIDPTNSVLPVSHDDEERTPSAHLTPTPGRDRSPIVEFLPTGMYIDGNLIEPGVIAIVQPNRTYQPFLSYKTVRLTDAECQEFYPLSLYNVIVDGEFIDNADLPHGEVGRKTVELYQRLIEPHVVMDQPQ